MAKFQAGDNAYLVQKGVIEKVSVSKITPSGGYRLSNGALIYGERSTDSGYPWEVMGTYRHLVAGYSDAEVIQEDQKTKLKAHINKLQKLYDRL